MEQPLQTARKRYIFLGLSKIFIFNALVFESPIKCNSHLASNSSKLSFIFAAAGYLTRPKEGFLLFILVQGSSLHDFTAKRYCCCSARTSARRAGQGLCASGRFGRRWLLGNSSAALPTSGKIKLFAAVIFFYSAQNPPNRKPVWLHLQCKSDIRSLYYFNSPVL